MRRGLLPVVAGLAVVAALVAIAPSARAGPSGARLVSTDVRRPPVVAVEVGMLRIADATPATAFRLWEDERLQAVTVAELPAETLRINVVVDTATTPTTLQQVRNAVTDLIVRLPDGAQVGVSSAGEVVQPLAADRAAALSALGALTPTARPSGSSAAPALDRAVADLARGTPGRRVVVLVSGADQITPPAGLSRALGAAGGALYVVSTNRGALDSRLADLARATGGGAFQASAFGGVSGALDAVAADLTRYQLSYRTSSTGTVRLRIAVAGMTGADLITTVRLPAPAGRAGRGFPTPIALLIAVVGLALLIAGGLLAARALRRRGRVPAQQLPAGSRPEGQLATLNQAGRLQGPPRPPEGDATPTSAIYGTGTSVIRTLPPLLDDIQDGRVPRGRWPRRTPARVSKDAQPITAQPSPEQSQPTYRGPFEPPPSAAAGRRARDRGLFDSSPDKWGKGRAP